jgi:hypothetical protein
VYTYVHVYVYEYEYACRCFTGRVRMASARSARIEVF